MKGLSLPINMIVVISLAVIVLVMLSFFFLSGSTEQINQAEAQRIYSSACESICEGKDIYQQGTEIFRAEDEFNQKFRQACIVLGYVSPSAGAPENQAAEIQTCLRSCGTCRDRGGNAQQYTDSIGNCVTNPETCPP